MEVTQGRPATELASLVSAALQNTRFKDRRVREAESDVRNEAIFYSPVVRIDADTQTAVLQYRNRETGEIQNEFPSKPASDRYAIAQKSAPETTASIPINSIEFKAPEKPAESVESVDVNS